MNKVATYLQSHLSGEVLVSEKVREHFSTDASILTIKPSIVVYPRTTNDIRKVARFSWQLAERGHVLPITARGNGTDLTGAAIGKGVILSMPAHLNKILELDTKQKLVRVQPGVNFKSLQETLKTHGLFLPPAPESYEYSTIGGALANNASNIRAHKYGDISNWVDRLEVVLANGEVIQTGLISKKEFNKKLGLPTLEGEIYRAVNAILSDGGDSLDGYQKSIQVAFDNTGFAFSSLRKKNGDIDLTQLFIGSQGTLGVIAEAILRVTSFTPTSSLTVAAFASVDEALEVAGKLSKFKPGVLDIVDGELLEFVRKHNNIELPDALKVDGKTPEALLFVEVDNVPPRTAQKVTKQITKVIAGFTDRFASSNDLDEQEKLWSFRYSTSAFMTFDTGGKAALPMIQAVAVPAAALHQFVMDAKALCKKHHADVAIAAHVLSGNVTALPLFDLSKLGDRQRVFKLMDEYLRLAIKLGGSIAAASSEGRLRAPYAKLQLGSECANLVEQLKAAADPHGTMNPGVKTGVTPKELVELLRKDYSSDPLLGYLPRL